MTLASIKIVPGINTEVPSLTSEPAWRLIDKVRFKSGQPEKIGGWLRHIIGLNAITGIARVILTWRLNNALIIVAIGTHEKLHLISDGTLTDITPLRETQAMPTDTFATVDTSTTVTVTDTSHGSNNGDYVGFTGGVYTGLTDTEVNANHKITLVDTNSYTIEVTTAATVTGDTGGASVIGKYEIPIGPISKTTSFGWGAGSYGVEDYGDERSISGTSISLRQWSLDSFGEDLVATHESGNLYTWAYDGGFTTRATLLTNAPVLNNIVLVTNPDRHLVVFASEKTGTQDKLLVVWADQETQNVWIPTPENTAGDHLLSGGSEIVGALRTQSTTLIWTDTGLHNMQFIGPPFTFGFEELGTNCGAVGRNVMIAKDSVVYWMGKDNFFIYDGVVKVLPCSVHRFVFQNIQYAQKAKVVAGLIKEFSEIIWFYPSTAGTENDLYVIYNFEQNIWYTGSLVRTTWEDSELVEFPLGIDTNGTAFHHETGMDDDITAMVSFIETSEFDVEEGDKFYLISRLIPDMIIPAGTVDYIFKTRRYPHATQLTDTTSTVTPTTEKIDLRIRTRQLTVRIESNALGDDWRMGVARIDIRPDGNR